MKLLGILIAGVIKSSLLLAAGAQPVFEGSDLQRKHIKVRLVPVMGGLEQPTDAQFLPRSNTRLLLCEKTGKVKFLDLGKKKATVVGQFAVRTQSELGVLGLTFHPKFPGTAKVYLNYNPSDGAVRTRISEFAWQPGQEKLTDERVLLEVAQPFPNHNGGQLVFGPDGYLYIGMGDGGSADDPQGNGQNPHSLLGKMLRIDVDKQTPEQPYAIPSDNPFVDAKEGKAEIFAIGLRNPWRYSFDPQRRLIVADVGQNLWEEISFVTKGANLGWKIKEANHCFDPKTGCKDTGLTPAFVQYPRDDGASITGGYSYMGKAIPELKGKYVFGDFVSGRIWAVTPPKKTEGVVAFDALGDWKISISTFGRNALGELFVADFAGGVLYSIQK